MHPLFSFKELCVINVIISRTESRLKIAFESLSFEWKKKQRPDHEARSVIGLDFLCLGNVFSTS